MRNDQEEMNNGHERPRKHVSKATAAPRPSNNNSESKIIMNLLWPMMIILQSLEGKQVRRMGQESQGTGA